MRALALTLMIVLLIPGCESDPVEPAVDASNSEVWFDGKFDGTEMVLQRIQQEGPHGESIELELVVTGSLFNHETNQLRATVHVRNQSDFYLSSPAVVGLRGFDPESVYPVNAVEYEDDPGRWWYHYNRSLGEDHILAPGELSEGLEWVLQLPARASFSFEAIARFGMASTTGMLGGRIYVDLNRNGEPDPDEPAGSGQIEVSWEGSASPITFEVIPGGFWFVPISSAGLYSIRWLPSSTDPDPSAVCTTTMNPRQVMILMQNADIVGSYTRADFGIDPEPCTGLQYMTIVLGDDPVEALESDPWTFAGVEQRGRYDGGRARLEFTLGISGCTSSHPMLLYVEPPDEEAIAASRMTATIFHNDLDEPCDAFLYTKRAVTLYTLRDHWEKMTGIEGPAELELFTSDGFELIDIR